MKPISLPHWPLALLLVIGSAQAIEFNDAFLELGAGGAASLESFAQPNFVPPGQYLVDLYLNQRFVDQLTLDFRVQGEDAKHVQACLPPDLLPRLALTTDAQALVQDPSCLQLARLNGASQRYHKSSGKLELSIPQAMLAFHDDNYVPPAAWNDGIVAALLDYRVSYQHRQNPHSAADNRLSGYGVAGINAGPWRLRSNFDYSDQGKQRTLAWNNTQAWRDIRSLYSRLTLGNFSYSSDVFNAFSINGLSLGSDDRMIPISLRGYAPRIEGIARTNAKVTIRSQGQTLYSTMVPPGPFSLQDLTSSVQGQLDVTVEEADGTIQSFTVQSASVPFLSRKGALRYKTAVGNAAQSSANTPNSVASAEASWGLTDTTSLYGGIIANPDYQAFALGSAYDLGSVGALSFDATQSRALLKHFAKQPSMAGRSYRFNYAKRFSEHDMDLRLAGYRFSDRRFWEFSEFLQHNTKDKWRQERQRLELNLAKRFGNTSVSLSAARRQFWNASDEQRLYLSLNRTVKLAALRNVNLNLAVQQNRSATTHSKEVSLSVSIPLDNKRQIAYSTQLSGGMPQQTASYSDASHDGHSYGVSASVGPKDTKPVLTTNYRYEGDKAISDVWLTQEVGGYRNLSASLSSSLLLHANGLTQNKASGGQTRLLVDTQGAKDVPLSDGRTHTDGLGHAVMVNMSPYQKQQVSLDSAHLPDNVEVKNPIQSVVLTDGAVGVARFKTDQGRRILATLTLPSGKMLPLGATVTDAQTHQELGLVGEDGLTYLSGIAKDSALQVRWGLEQRCRIPALPADADISQGTLALTCQPETPQ